MLYFPIKYVVLPDWLGGSDFLFFSPIFNVADASITIGVLCILLFQRSFFREGLGTEPTEPAAETAEVLGDRALEEEEAPIDVPPAESITYEKPSNVEPVVLSEIPSESSEDKDKD